MDHGDSELYCFGDRSQFSLCVVISSMEYSSLVVEPRKPSFSSKVSPYSAPESRLVGCFTAPSPISTGLPSRQPFWSSRSTPYRVSGGSLLSTDRRLLWPNPQDTTGPSICGSGDTKVYPRGPGFTPSTHPVSDHSWLVLESCHSSEVRSKP